MNITELLSLMASRSLSDHSRREGLRISSELFPGSEVDWDEGAGERWARIAVGDDAATLLWMPGGLAIVRNSAAAEQRLGQLGWAVLKVESMTEPVFTADVEALRTFAGRELSDGFDPQSFSVEDLVWTST